MKEAMVRGEIIDPNREYRVGVLEQQEFFFMLYSEYHGKIRDVTVDKLCIIDGIKYRIFNTLSTPSYILQPSGMFEKMEIPLEDIAYFGRIEH